MPPNRSLPNCTVIPQFAYAEVVEAMRWLCDAFGFTLRIRIANHRVPLNVGDGAAVLTELGANARPGEIAHSVMVRVSDLNSHHDRAKKHGAKSLHSPTIIPMVNGNIPLKTSAAIAGRSLNPPPMSIPKNGAATRATVSRP